jgi:hypothetical protein
LYKFENWTIDSYSCVKDLRINDGYIDIDTDDGLKPWCGNWESANLSVFPETI